MIAPLGAGGMGVVYRAEDETLRRVVALKLLPDASGSDERRQRFLREARSAAAITHPNVATVYTVGEAEGRVYIAMELVAGENLRERMARGRLDLETAKDLATQIARGLSAAHEQGIVHRDLKPENVMITPAGVVKLLDFGLAKTALERPASGKTEAALAKTETLVTSDEGRIMGTPEYMSPEQALGAPLDVRSDVFSLGIVLYEMLAGQRPFDATTTGALLVAIARDAPRPLREVAPEVDEGLEAIVTRCLAKAPAERFASAAEIVNALSGQASPRATTVSRTEGATQAKTGDGAKGTAWGRVAIGVVAVMALVGVGAWAGTRGKASTAPAAVVSASAAPSSSSSSQATAYTARRLTQLSNGASITDVALTPDGKSFVFSDKDGLWIQPLAGGPRRALGGGVKGFGAYAGLSYCADRDHIVVATGASDRIVIWSVPLDGGSPTRMHEIAGADSAIASPEGSRVAWIQRESLFVQGFDGGPAVAVSTGAIASVIFSPDGSHFAFTKTEALGSSIYIASSDGSTVTHAYSGPLLGPGLYWDRSGILATTTSQNGYSSLLELQVDPDGHLISKPRELWQTAAYSLGGVSTHDGRFGLIIAQAHAEVQIAELAPGAMRLSTPPRVLLPQKAASYAPAWLTDGRVAFLSNRDIEQAVYAMRPGDAEPTLLASRPTHDSLLEPLRTGELIASLSAGDAGASRLVVASLAGATRELVPAASSSDCVRCGGGDPRRCVLGSLRNDHVVLSRIDASTGSTEPPFFTAKMWSRFAVSPDGKQVAVVDNSPSVTLVDLATGSSRSMTTTPGGTMLQSVEFSPDGQTLLISGIGFGAIAFGIVGVDLNGRGSLLQTSQDAWLTTPRVSPDGRHLAFESISHDSDVWLLEPK
jgi:WD40 repeat protein